MHGIKVNFSVVHLDVVCAHSFWPHRNLRIRNFSPVVESVLFPIWIGGK